MFQHQLRVAFQLEGVEGMYQMILWTPLSRAHEKGKL